MTDDTAQTTFCAAIPEKGYVDGGDETFRYPAAGDPEPPMGSKVLLLTRGGICVVGTWGRLWRSSFLGWAPLPSRDKTKERDST